MLCKRVAEDHECKRQIAGGNFRFFGVNYLLAVLFGVVILYDNFGS